MTHDQKQRLASMTSTAHAAVGDSNTLCSDGRLAREDGEEVVWVKSANVEIAWRS